MQPQQSDYFSDALEIFSKFPDLPYDVRHLIWECCLPGPRVIEIDAHVNKTGQKQWGTRAPRPALLSICQESRRIAKRRYAFCSGPDVCLWIDPLIDTLYFGPTGSDLDLLDFLIAANGNDLKALKSLAINEMHLAAWMELSKPRSNLISNALLPVLDGLERLMIGVQVASLDYYPNMHLAPDEWEGWLFGGGALTAEERLIHAGSLPELSFSPNSVDDHLFHITDSPEYPDDHPGVQPMELINLFSFYYPLELERTGRPREVMARLGPWYRRIYSRLARMDVRLTRMFEMYQGMRHEQESACGSMPQVACFVRPAESFRCWEDSLRPLCEADWEANREEVFLQTRGECLRV